MGWASGSGLFTEIMKAARKAIPDRAKRSAFYLEIIGAFENEDWDTQDECRGSDKAFDDALKELHPEWDL